MGDEARIALSPLFMPRDLEDALDQTDLEALDRLVFVRMMSRAGAGGECFESAASIGAGLKISERRVRTAQARLTEVGLFVAEKRTGVPTRYRWTGGMNTGAMTRSDPDPGTSCRGTPAPRAGVDANPGTTCRGTGVTPARGADEVSQELLASQPASAPGNSDVKGAIDGRAKDEGADHLAAWDLDGAPPPATQPGTRPLRGRNVASPNDPALSDEASFAASFTGAGSAKRAVVEARAFFASVWSPRQMAYPQVSSRMLGWYRLHGADVLTRLWSEALANGDGKEPFWWFVNALGGQFQARSLATATQPATPIPVGMPLAHAAGIEEGGLVVLPDGTEAFVDAVVTNGRYAMLEGHNAPYPIGILKPVGREVRA